MTEFMLETEQQCGKAVYSDRLPYSRELWEANKKAFECKKHLRQINIGYHAATQEESEIAERNYK